MDSLIDSSARRAEPIVNQSAIQFIRGLPLILAMAAIVAALPVQAAPTDASPDSSAAASAPNPEPLPRIVINEIRYHSASGKRSEEFIELHNPGEKPVDLTAWQVTDGIRFLFEPGTRIPAGGFLIVAADPETLRAAAVAEVPVLGPYAKNLSHKADRIELRAPEGDLVDRAVYEDDSPWPKEADGQGPSLERIHPSAPGDLPEAWRAASVPGGTPGARNSAFDPRASLWLVRGAHHPLTPSSREPVRLRVESVGLTDPQAVTAEWWVDGGGERTQVPLAPDSENPRRWTAIIGPFPNNTLVEYCFRATADSSAESAVFPPRRKGEPDGFLLQIDDAPATSTRPVYRLLARGKDWKTLLDRPVQSNDLLPGAFVAGDRVWQRVGFRYRGSSSRVYAPRKSYLIRFPRLDSFRDRRDHCFNANYFEAQYLAMKTFARAGIEAPAVDLVGLAINNAFTGHYCWMEEIDSDFARRHFNNPEDVKIWEGKENADLAFRGTDPNAYAGYKPVAPSKDLDPAPIIALCHALEPRKDPHLYQFTVQLAIDADEWIRFFAVNSLLANIEGAIMTSKGEDYYLCQPSLESPFVVLPWDVNESMLVPYFPITAQQVPAVRRFLSFPPFAAQYRAELERALNTFFSPRSTRAMISEIRDVAEPDSFNLIRDFLAARPHEVRAQLPQSIDAVVRKPGPRYVAGLGATWKLFYRSYPPKGGSGEWTKVEYNDTMENEWFDASMPFGFAPEGLLGAKGRGSYIPPAVENKEEITFYVRRRFAWDEDRTPENLRLLIRSSAGHVVYLNGVEVSRFLMPEGPVRQSTRAAAMNPATTPMAVDLRPFTKLVQKGENVIAIESHMASHHDARRVLDAVLVEGDPQVGQVVLGETRLRLAGEAPVPPVSEVRLGGWTFPVDPWGADWGGEIELRPGWNRFVLSGRDSAGDRVSTSTIAWFRAGRATPAPARIDTEVVWNEAGSPYRITKTLEIDPKGVLRLEPGTVVVLEPWATVLCRGMFLSQGTADRPVTITGLDADAQWGTILGLGEDSRLLLQHTEISGCSYVDTIEGGARTYTLGGIEVWSGKLYADHCVVTDTTAAAFVGGAGAEVTLRHCRMERTGCGFLSWDSAWTLEDCLVLHTRNSGDGIDIDGEGPRSGAARRCVFADLANDGIDFGSCSALVEDCLVWGAADKGLSLDGKGRPVFRRCVIGDCDRGIGVKTGTLATLEELAVLACRVGVDTRLPTDRGGGGYVDITDGLVARCPTPLQGPENSIRVRNVYFDLDEDTLAEFSRVLDGKPNPGLLFSAPAQGDWSIAAPVRTTTRDLIGLPLDSMIEHARRFDVDATETGLRWIPTE